MRDIELMCILIILYHSAPDNPASIVLKDCMVQIFRCVESTKRGLILYGKYPIRMANSDKSFLQVLGESNRYLELKTEISSKIGQSARIFRFMKELLSHHIFPIGEAVHELENSIQLCKLGFYKHALTALRSTLELGLLSVYWNLEDQDHVKMQKWLRSHEYTPSNKTVIDALKTNKNINAFDVKHNFFKDIESLLELSKFVHTRGVDYSYNDLSNGDMNCFKEASFLKWLDYFLRVVKIVVIGHVLKYPIALQYLPLEQKFGLNLPVGGFLEPYQSEAIKEFLDEDVVKTLQTISDSDDDAVTTANLINAQPDITTEEMQKQVDEFDKERIW